VKGREESHETGKNRNKENRIQESQKYGHPNLNWRTEVFTNSGVAVAGKSQALLIVSGRGRDNNVGQLNRCVGSVQSLG
jgi:hypothetical protein